MYAGPESERAPCFPASLNIYDIDTYLVICSGLFVYEGDVSHLMLYVHEGGMSQK